MIRSYLLLSSIFGVILIGSNLNPAVASSVAGVENEGLLPAVSDSKFTNSGKSDENENLVMDKEYESRLTEYRVANVIDFMTRRRTPSLRADNASTTTGTAGAAAANNNNITAGISDQDQILNQVSKILQNVASLNIVGIVDESLAVGGSPPVRNFVNGVLRGVFCNPITSLFNRCSVASTTTTGGITATNNNAAAGTSNTNSISSSNNNNNFLANLLFG